MVEFLDANITNKFKNKLIILDNASSHRNLKVKEIIKTIIYYYKQFKMYKLKHWFDIENFY